MAKRSKRPENGCCNCKYSFESDRDNNYYCDRKAGGSKKVSSKNWLKTECKNWEYDGVSEGFDPQEEYDKMPYNC